LLTSYGGTWRLAVATEEAQLVSAVKRQHLFDARARASLLA